MENYQQELIDTMQTQVDLIEGGVIRAASVLIDEMHAAVADEKLTLEKIRLFEHKLNQMLYAFDDADKRKNEYQACVLKSNHKAESDGNA